MKKVVRLEEFACVINATVNILHPPPITQSIYDRVEEKETFANSISEL